VKAGGSNALCNSGAAVSRKMKDELEKAEIDLGQAVKKGQKMLEGYAEQKRVQSAKFGDSFRLMKESVQAGMKTKAFIVM
jgi:hypothetical protein